MNRSNGSESEASDGIVYIRTVATKNLPQEVREKVGMTETVFAVHDSEGKRLALVRNRHVAFALARQNDMAPVSVH